MLKLNGSRARFWVSAGIVLGAAAIRLLPYSGVLDVPPNVTPIAAMALFGGAFFASRRATFLVPLVAMLLSDLALAATVYGTAALGSMPFVYASFIAIVGLGLLLRQRRTSPLAVGGAALSGSVLFFLVTNFGVWLRGTMYPLTVEGLAACYTAAIPFFRNTLAGDLFYVLVLFGGFALAQRYVPALREPQPLATPA